MIIAGAKGFAKEILEVLWRDYNEKKILLFDNVNDNISGMLFNKFKIIKNISELYNVNDTNFCLGVGTPYARSVMYNLLSTKKIIKSIISSKATIGSFGNNIGDGCSIMDNVVITNSVTIGIATLINLNCTIGHDTVIGGFCDISPNVNISGHCNVGDYTSIGTGSVLIPKVTIGDNCVIGAGTVVTKNIPNNSVVVGVPGRVIKQNK